MKRLCTALLLAAVTLGACDTPAPEAGCKNDDQPLAGVDGGIQCDAPYALAEPDGSPARFAVKVVQYIHMNSAGLVETDTIGAAIGWADYVVEPGSTAGSMELKLCHLEVPKIQIPGQPVASSLELVPGALDHVPPAPTPFVVSEYRTCGSYLTEPSVVLVAARLVNGLEDPLPWDASTQTCPSEQSTGCLFDQDKDGKPAVTFIANNFPALPVDEIYATLRSWVVMDGIAATPDMLLGTAYFGLDIAVVGCRIAPLGGGDVRDCNADESDVIAQITPTFTQTPSVESTFLAVRVAPTTDCEYVIAEADRLFGR